MGLFLLLSGTQGFNMENRRFLGTSPKTGNMMARKNKSVRGQRNLVLPPLGCPSTGGWIKGGFDIDRETLERPQMSPEARPLVFSWETQAVYPHPPEPKSRTLQKTCAIWSWCGEQIGTVVTLEYKAACCHRAGRWHFTSNCLHF